MSDVDALLAGANAEVRALDDLRRKYSQALAELDRSNEDRRKAERELSMMIGLDKLKRTTPPKWLTKPPKSKPHRGTAWLLLSDLHLDEVVDPAQVGGVNKYDRAIAELRLRTTIEQTVKICRDYWTGVAYDGIVAPLAGDLFAGDIHDELKHTNADVIMGSVLHWSDQLASALTMLADEFGKVHVPVVVGNHGRTTRKPMAKFRARTNWDWFTGHLIARTLAGDSRITFDIGEGADNLTKTYDKTVCITHGDQVTGGSGIGGIWPPIMRLDARKRARYQAVSQPYDLMVLGHWHQATFGPNFIINGSLVGYDEYAAVSNFGFQEPAQCLWVMTPERGRTWMTPVYPQDRTKEGW